MNIVKPTGFFDKFGLKHKSTLGWHEFVNTCIYNADYTNSGLVLRVFVSDNIIWNQFITDTRENLMDEHSLLTCKLLLFILIKLTAIIII